LAHFSGKINQATEIEKEKKDQTIEGREGGLGIEGRKKSGVRFGEKKFVSTRNAEDFLQ